MQKIRLTYQMRWSYHGSRIWDACVDVFQTEKDAGKIKNHVCLKTFISVYFNIYVLYSRKVFTSKKLDVHYNTVYSQEIHWKIFDLCIKRAAFTLMSNGYEKTMGISWMSVDLITIMKFNNYDLPSAINLIAYVSPWTVAGNQKDLCS